MDNELDHLRAEAALWARFWALEYVELHSRGAKAGDPLRYEAMWRNADGIYKSEFGATPLEAVTRLLALVDNKRR